MTASEILPWVNLLLVPILVFVIQIERRIVRLETIQEFGRRFDDPPNYERVNHEKK